MFAVEVPRRFMAGSLATALIMAPLLAGGPALAADEPEMTSFTLDNGLEVVVIPDRRAPVVTHMIWYKVGSADEEPGKSGIAHFLEHLLFKGTENHAAGEFSAYIASAGGRENAFTSYDYTAYFQQIAPGELEAMMRFEADRMRNLALTSDDVETERQVIIEERSQVVENRPESVLAEEVNATLYQNHPYGTPIIGWMHEIHTLDMDSIVAFYDRFYAPNNAVLVVAGDAEADEVRAMAERTYGLIARGEHIGPRVRPSEPEQKTRRTVTLNDARVGVASVTRRWLVPTYRTATDGEGEALDLMSEILGGGTRSRLYQELVVRQGIARSAGAFYQGTSHDYSSFGVYGSPRGEATIEEVERAIEAEVERLAAEGVSEDELERAKNRFVRSMVFARDNQSGMARMYGAVLASGGTVDDITGWTERVRAVTPEAVQAVARRYLESSRSVTSYLLPQEPEDRT